MYKDEHLWTWMYIYIRGGIKIENWENLGQCPNRGWVGNKKTKMSQFQFGNFENRGGGSLFFKNVPISIILQLFCNITFIRNVWKSKMSEFDPRGGSAIFKNVWNSKKSEISDGGGVKPIWEFFPKFFRFFFMMAPLTTIEPQTFLILRIFLAWNFPSFLLFHLV